MPIASNVGFDPGGRGCVLRDSMLFRYISKLVSAVAFISLLILQDFLSLHRDVFGCLLVDLSRALNGDILAFDLNRTVLFHQNASLTRFNEDFVARFDSEG